MSGVCKIVGKVAIVLAGSIALGYAEYRLKGGEPIRKLYREVKEERLAAEEAVRNAIKRKYIVVNEEDCKVE